MSGKPAFVSLRFDDHGSSGSPALLLIHGHPFNRSMWQPQVRAAVDMGWRVVIPDLRGYGQSSPIVSSFAFEAFAGDLLSLLDDLSIDRFVVGGLSMGGQVAMDVCRQAPHRVRGLLLAATFPQSESPEGKIRRYAMADRLISQGMAGYATEVLPKMVGELCLKDQPDIGRAVLEMMLTTNPHAAAAALRARAERPPYEQVLAQFARPASVVVGDHDAFTTRDDALKMASLLQDCDLQWMPGVGHMPNLEQPEQFNAVLARLLKRVAASAY